MSENGASRTVSDNSRVSLIIVASLIEDSIGLIYDHNMFIVQATGGNLIKPFLDTIDILHHSKINKSSCLLHKFLSLDQYFENVIDGTPFMWPNQLWLTMLTI
jgi:hypothetical protein